MCSSHIRPRNVLWGHSSAGRASDLHSEGHRFDPDWLHQTPNFMIYSIFLSLFFLISIYLIFKNTSIRPGFKELFLLNRAFFRKEKENPLFEEGDRVKVWLYLSLSSFLLLPLIWGLSLFLKTDFNVIIVILWMFWVYNWLKYILQEKKKKEKKAF